VISNAAVYLTLLIVIPCVLTVRYVDSGIPDRTKRTFLNAYPIFSWCSELPAYRQSHSKLQDSRVWSIHILGFRIPNSELRISKSSPHHPIYVFRYPIPHSEFRTPHSMGHPVSLSFFSVSPLRTPNSLLRTYTCRSPFPPNSANIKDLALHCLAMPSTLCTNVPIFVVDSLCAPFFHMV
jgi:hypothetical protein